ncbi:MAG: helix-turn-helix domain-containing protein, partial [Thiobacillus sp.]
MSNLKQVLRENTLRLLAAEGRMKSNETGVSRLVAKGIGQGTAQRILEGKTSIGLETLEQLAGVLGVSPWRLILPMSNGE